MPDVVGVDPSSHNANTLGIFGGWPLLWDCPTPASRDDEGLDAVRRFIEEHRTLPTVRAWRAAAMSPSERTIRRRFGSFKAAVETARDELDHSAFGGPSGRVARS